MLMMQVDEKTIVNLMNVESIQEAKEMGYVLLVLTMVSGDALKLVGWDIKKWNASMKMLQLQSGINGVKL